MNNEQVMEAIMTIEKLRANLTATQNRERDLIHGIETLEAENKQLRAEVAIRDRKTINDDGTCVWCGLRADGSGVNKCYCVPTIRQFRDEADQLRADLAAANAARKEWHKVDSERIEALNERVVALEDDLEHTRAELAAARAALEAVEWVWNKTTKSWHCAYCDRLDIDGHAPDCARQVALGLAKKPETT